MATPLTYLKLKTTTSIIDVPIYNIADVANSSYRIMTHKGLGCFDLVADSVSLPLKIMTSTGIKAINTQTQAAFSGLVRYVRDWSRGSNVNSNNHWIEVMAITTTDTNAALGKAVTTSGTLFDSNLITDGITNNVNGYSQLNTAQTVTPHYVQIDLGAIHTLKEVKVWHYYADSRVYQGTKTEVSEDGVVWRVLFDSAVSGTYTETAQGRTYAVV